MGNYRLRRVSFQQCRHFFDMRVKIHGDVVSGYLVNLHVALKVWATT